MIIENGKGDGGYGAAVNDKNQLLTRSTSTPELLFHSKEDEDVFSTYNKHTIQADDTEEYVCYLKYTGDSILILKKMFVSCNDMTNACKFEVYVDLTSPGGGADVTPSNWNRKSNNSIDTVTKHTNSGASAITGTNGTEIMCFYSKPEEGMKEISLDGLILGTNNNIFIIAENKAGNKVRVTLHYYED